MSLIAEWRRRRSEQRRRRCAAARLESFVAAGNRIELSPEDLCRVYIEVVGRGNAIRIGRMGAGAGRMTVRVFADDSSVEIGEGLSVSQGCEIVVGGIHPECGSVRDASVRIGTNTGVESARIATYTSHSHIRVGSDCMIAYDVNLYHGDAHPVYDLETAAIVNRVDTMSIGNHVWIGAKATLLKNVQIADGCIVGWGSVVTGKFTTPNVAIAGNPAVVRGRRNVRWAVSDPAYIANEDHQ